MVADYESVSGAATRSWRWRWQCMQACAAGSRSTDDGSRWSMMACVGEGMGFPLFSFVFILSKRISWMKEGDDFCLLCVEQDVAVVHDGGLGEGLYIFSFLPHSYYYLSILFFLWCKRLIYLGYMCGCVIMANELMANKGSGWRVPRLGCSFQFLNDGWCCWWFLLYFDFKIFHVAEDEIYLFQTKYTYDHFDNLAMTILNWWYAYTVCFV